MVTLVDDEKIIDIETKLAHQEHLLSALDDALSNQQAQIAELEHLCQSLVERIRALSEAGGENIDDDERPPHY
ncbi:MAG: SlyX family protein [Gammaproteobacteria bacterium]|nr:MAG: SlyX family protein [Gammaproteobacteria bacterium]